MTNLRLDKLLEVVDEEITLDVYYDKDLFKKLKKQAYDVCKLVRGGKNDSCLRSQIHKICSKFNKKNSLIKLKYVTGRVLKADLKIGDQEFSKDSRVNAGFGRLHDIDFCSYVTITRPARYAMLLDFATELDIENCHPRIIEHLYEHIAGKPSPEFHLWNTQREDIFKFVINASSKKITRDDAKSLAFTFLYGGSIKNRLEELGISEDNEHIVKLTNLMTNLKRVAKTVIKYFKTNYPSLWNNIVPSKDSNIDFSRLSHLIQHLEKQAILCVMKCVEANGFHVHDISFDGLVISTKDFTPPNSNQFEFIKKISESALKETFGFNLKIIEKKPVDTAKLLSYLNGIIDYPEEPDYENRDGHTDKQCAEIFASLHLNKTILVSDEGLICYNKDLKVWNIGDQSLSKMIQDSDIKKKGKPYTANTSGRKNVLEEFKVLVSDIPRGDHIAEICNRTKDKLFFCAGPNEPCTWFNLLTGESGTVEDSSQAGLRLICRKMPNFSKYHIDHPDVVRAKTLINDIFDVMDVIYMGVLGRSAGGHYEDKLVFGLDGARDSGKGVACEIAECALGSGSGDGLGYVTVISVPILKDKDMGESAKNRSDIITSNMSITRIAFMNELQGSSKAKIDGNTLKSYASGGDKIVARRNYSNEVRVVNRSTMFMHFNMPVAGHNIPNIEPVDTLEKYYGFGMPFHFSPVLDGSDTCKLGDESLKSKIKADVDLQNAYIWLLHYYFLTKPITRTSYTNRHGTFPLPQCMLDTNQRILKQINSPINTFPKYFKFTGSSSDYVLVSDVYELLDGRVSKNILTKFINDSFKSQLIAKGMSSISPSRKYVENENGSKSQKRVYLGIKQIAYKNNDNENDENDEDEFEC